MTVEQLALALVPLPGRSAGYDARHQLGHYPAPWDFAAGPAPGVPAPRKGNLVPAWRCCYCGGIEMTRHRLEMEHNCCRDWAMPSCYYRPLNPASPHRMDAHWIPPQGWSQP